MHKVRMATLLGNGNVNAANNIQRQQGPQIRIRANTQTTYAANKTQSGE